MRCATGDTLFLPRKSAAFIHARAVLVEACENGFSGRDGCGTIILSSGQFRAIVFAGVKGCNDMAGLISAIVVNWKRSVLLERALASLVVQTVQAEIIVVENESSGDEHPLAQLFPNARWILNRGNPGFCRANNQLKFPSAEISIDTILTTMVHSAKSQCYAIPLRGQVH